MDQNWREEWESAKARLEERRRLLERAALQRRRNRELEQQCAELRREYELEQKDVDRLQGLGFQSVWRSLMGDRKELLKKEEQEAAEAQIRYRDAYAERELRAEKVAALEAEAAQLQGAEAELEAVTLRREQALRSTPGPRGSEIDSLLVERDALLAERQEIREAQLAGNDAGESLDDALEVLKSAKNWGLFDLFGGGLIATAVKQGKINEARGLLEHAGHALWDFEKELRDVGEISLPTIDIDQLGTFLDYFLDGLLVDAFIQSRITRAVGQTEETLSQVEEIQRGLDARVAEIDQELGRGRERLRGLVEDGRS